MERKLNVNTHHGFLNTEIIITTSQLSIDVKDNLTGIDYHIDGALSLKLSAGKHILSCEYLNEEVTVFIEDAIKLGGAKIKQAYAFDNNPWVFVITKDRLYATNTLTKDEKVEYNICPDEVHSFDMFNGKTNNYFLFKTNEDYSIYDVVNGRHIINFKNYIYGNSHLVIFKKNDIVVVYDYRKCEQILEVSGRYAIGKKLYYIQDNKLFVLNLRNNFIKPIEKVGNISDYSILTKDYLLKINMDLIDSKKYYLYSLNSDNIGFAKSEINVPHYILSFDGIESKIKDDLMNEYDTFKSELKDQLVKYCDIHHHITGINIDTIKSLDENNVKVLVLTGELNTIPTQTFKIPIILKGKENDVLNFEINSASVYDNRDEVDLLKIAPNINLQEGEKEIGKSQSGNLVVIKNGDKIYLRNQTTNETKSIFANSFDSSSYNSAYFTSDGKNVIFVNRDNSMSIMGFEDMIQSPFSIEGSTVARRAGFNGYKLEVFVSEGRLPVWRDPITLRRVSEAEMSNHIFMSPDEKYVADISMETKYINRLTNEEITELEYRNICNMYDNLSFASDEEKKEILLHREQLLSEYGDTLLFDHIYKKNERLFSYQRNKLSETTINNQINYYNKQDSEKYLKKENNFSCLFIDKLGYVCYKNVESNKKQFLLIGRNVRFLNYVSFSYNSRYLAFGAKMGKDSWRDSEEGVFEIYDLIENKVVVRKDIGIDLHAVWMCMFSKDGNVTYYDSHPNTFIAKYETGYKDIKEIYGKSLLCFSPSGKYIALSDQKYIDYTHHPDSKWGHQPSGNIFIYKVSNLDKCIEQHNDFGDGIDGTTKLTQRHGNVASAAFSSDEKRLLAVDQDGVIVIRNLHLEDK